MRRVLLRVVFSGLAGIPLEVGMPFEAVVREVQADPVVPELGLVGGERGHRGVAYADDALGGLVVAPVQELEPGRQRGTGQRVILDCLQRHKLPSKRRSRKG